MADRHRHRAASSAHANEANVSRSKVIFRERSPPTATGRASPARERAARRPGLQAPIAILSRGKDCNCPPEGICPSGAGPNARRRGRCAGRSRALGQPSQMGGQAPISSVVGLFGRRGAASPDTTAKAATPVSAADANVSLRVWCDEEREPSRLCSGTSCGLLGTGLCGIGRRPSAVASRPVRIASTPGASAAAATSILACACGERRMYAKACPAG